ncbi:MAG TPA: DUF4623 domain-containing protein [Verrucomicrobiota bacterium]|nr:DUF4623 domain-containing protein [Verrucomicrobiota bacterium]
MKKDTLRVAAVVATLLATGSLQAQLQLEQVWTLAPGARSYLTTDNTQRGLAYNPVTGHLLLANRAGGVSVNVMDSLTGADLGTLDVTGIAGGTFALNLIDVAADGAIYGANLTLNGSTDPFKVYRWASETAAPTLVYSGNPGPSVANRFGDTFAVRGAGNDTQILAASRAGTVGAVLLTPDGGSSFVAYEVATDAAAGDIGLGATFGTGNDFWATASGRTLRHLEVNTSTMSAMTVGNFGAAEGVPLATAFLGIEPTLGVLAGVELFSDTALPTPDNLNFYDISSGTPVWLDSEVIPTGNANLNGTGAIDFGNGMMYVLESNNGVTAYAMIPEPGTYLLLGLGLVALWARRKV